MIQDPNSLQAISFGSAMVDTITILDDESIERLTLANARTQFMLVEPGHKVDAHSIAIHVGGGAMNAAVTFARLGLKSIPVVMVGNDVERVRVKAYCQQQKLSQEGIFTHPTQPTGSSVLISSHDHNAAIFTRRGANTGLTTNELSQVNRKFDKVDLLYIAPLSGDSAAMLPMILEFGTKRQAFIACNPGAKQIQKYGPCLLAGLPQISLLSINLEEAALLVAEIITQGVSPPLSFASDHPLWIKSEMGNFPLAWLGQELVKLGLKRLIITAGKHGSYLYSQALGLIHQPIVKVKVAGTAGAGDAFASTSAGLLSLGFDEEQSLRLAARNAASVISFEDTTSGLLTLKDLQS